MVIAAFRNTTLGKTTSSEDPQDTSSTFQSMPSENIVRYSTTEMRLKGYFEYPKGRKLGYNRKS
jgi:hypothetical protein